MVDSSVFIAQWVGILTSGVVTGGILYISYGVVPVLMTSPASLLALQWRKMYLQGARTAPPIALTSCLANSYLAYTLRNSPVNPVHPCSTLYAVAAAITIAIVPWTLVVMRNVNGTLMKKAVEVEKRGGGKGEAVDVKMDGVHELVGWWYWLNLLRGVFTGTGFALCTYASLSC
ncbi:MAG: hypothetical protein Q9187_008320 [Circinaria calcarea]